MHVIDFDFESYQSFFFFFTTFMIVFSQNHLKVYSLTKRDRSCTSSTMTWVMPVKFLSPCKLNKFSNLRFLLLEEVLTNKSMMRN